MKRKVIFLVLLSFLLVGCGVASKSNMISYANSNYGNAKLISYSKSDDSSTAVFLDKDYNFQYKVHSSMSSIDIDGSYFGSVPSKSDNYKEMFVSYLKGKIDNDFSSIERECNCSIKWNSYFYTGNTSIIDVYFNLDDVKDYMIKIGNLVSSYDKKNFLRTTYIYAHYNDDVIGKYDFSSESFLSHEDMKIDWAKNTLYYHLDSIYKRVKSMDIKFLEVKVMDAHDVPGIESHIINQGVGITEETLKNTSVYYFKYKKETWIVADCVVDGGRTFINKIS